MASSKRAGEAPISWHLGKERHAPSVNNALPLIPDVDTPLASLIDIHSLRALLNDFSTLVGIATALVDLEGNVIQFAGWQRACTDFHRYNARSCTNCNESDLYLANNLQEGEFIDYKCKNGLWDVVTPVFVGKQHLANLYCGQFFYDEDVIDEAYFVGQAERFGYDKPSYLAAIHAMPRFSRQFVRRVMAHIVNLASYLSHLSLTNLKLSESRSQMETLLNTLPDPVWLKDMEGVYLTCNQAFERLVGAPASAIIGKTDYDFFPAAQADFFLRKDHEAILASTPNANEEWVRVAGSEKQVLMETTKTSLPGASGQPVGVLGIAHDITERKRSEEYLHLMSKVFSNSGEAILITDANKRILAVNREFTKLTGYCEAEVIGKKAKFLSHRDMPKHIYLEMLAKLAENDYWQGELWGRRKTGEAYPKRLSISVVRDAEGKIVNYIGNFEDITHRKAAEDKIRYLAHHDVLTGLPNRFSLQERMEQCIAFAKRFDSSLAVVLIDLDHFKTINDTLGHDVGDQLLIQVAKRLQQSVRDSDIVARLGGDEFVVILSGIEMSTEITEVASKIIAHVAAPYTIGRHELRTSPSVGICFYPSDATETGELIKNADIAMYHAKSVGRCNYQFYTEKMREEVAQRVTVEHELKLALKKGQFVLHYQPQIELGSGRVIGVEALVRWQHPVHGIISPCDFISIAEETKMIIPLGKWILESACSQLKQWHEEGLSDLHVSVNLSALQFQDEMLPQMVRQALGHSNLEAHYLHLEITETMAMQNPEENIVMMNTLAKIGVKLAIDDFGTGYSSLAYLKTFPVDIIKIDRSFVKDLEIDEDDAAICEITLLLAQKLGMLVVAEGVETAPQSQFLSSRDCQWVQGYLFSKPLSADLVEEYIREFCSARVPVCNGHSRVSIS